MSDEEIMAAVNKESLEEKVGARIEKLGEEYDLSDMKYHDLLVLQRFFTALVRLEDAERELADRYDKLTPNEKAREESALSTLRNDVLKMQNELGISKLRRNEQVEDNPMVLFADIRQRAKRFLDERLCWVNCKKCGMQICKVHFTYPKADNYLRLVCARCDAVNEYTSAELLETEHGNPYK